jgi:hypothetical protein
MLIVAAVCKWHMFIRCYTPHMHVLTVTRYHHMARIIPAGSHDWNSTWLSDNITPAGNHHGTWLSVDKQNLQVVTMARGYQMTHITPAGSHHGAWLSDDTHHTCR